MGKHLDAQANLIYTCEIGSTSYGTGIGDDDLDIMGIFIEPPAYVISGYVDETKRLETVTFRTAAEGERSKPGDIDEVYHSLRKWVKLAANGNPSVLNLLFAPIRDGKSNPFTSAIRDLAPEIVSKRMASAYRGYLTQQKERLLGIQSNNVYRPELIEKYGYDCKYAYHALRLGYQGIEILSTGKLTIPLKSAVRDVLLDIRAGLYPLEEVVAMIEDQEELLCVAEKDSTLPEAADMDKLSGWLVTTHLQYWDYKKFITDALYVF